MYYRYALLTLLIAAFLPVEADAQRAPKDCRRATVQAVRDVCAGLPSINAYEGNMSVIAATFLDNARTDDTGDYLFAYMGTSLRGVKRAHRVRGALVYYLTVFGEASERGEQISYVLYDGSSEQMIALDETHAFAIDARYGDTSQFPEELRGTTPSGRSAGVPPQLTTAIPGQTISSGGTFTPLALDEFVYTPASTATNWSGEGTALRVELHGDRAEVVPPSPDWTGVDDVRFTIRDQEGQTRFRTSRFRVLPSGISAPDWPALNWQDWQHCMMVWATLGSTHIDSTAQVLVAAFAGDDYRGVVEAEFISDEMLFPLEVFAIGAGETISFKLWDSVTDVVRDLPATYTFEGDAKVGSFEEPVDLTAGSTSSESEEAPAGYALSQNYPNPFNPQTAIPFSLAETAHVTLVVTDLLGREVHRLVDARLAAGRHTARLSGGDLPSGLYLYRLTTPAGSLTRSMTLLR